MPTRLKSILTLALMLSFVTDVMAQTPVEYVRDVKPILKERCYACHGALKQESGLRLDTGNAIRQGGDGGSIVHSGDGGQTWTTQNSGTRASLYVIAAPTRESLWAVGDSGVILRSSDGGTSWRRQYSPASASLFCVEFDDSRNGWISGDFGTILRLSDGTNSAPQREASEENIIGFIYPNPFYAATCIAVARPSSASSPTPGDLSLRVYDAFGREVLDASARMRGMVESAADGHGNVFLHSSEFPGPGMYFLEARAGLQRDMRRLIVRR